MSRIIATLGFVGYLKPAPGTWGSLAALPLAWAVHTLGGALALVIGLFVVLAVGWWAVSVEEASGTSHDASEIVIDEVVGQWLALLPVSIGASIVGADILALWPGIVAAFLGFRLFDIWKPGAVGWADRQPGALGVMLDDLVAGLMAAGVVVILAALAHIPMML